MYAEEMADALENRPDIFPPVVVGTNMAGGEMRRKSAPKEDKSGEPAEKRPKRPKLQGDETTSKCLEVLQNIANRQQQNEERRLDLLERLVTSFEKKEKK